MPHICSSRENYDVFIPQAVQPTCASHVVLASGTPYAGKKVSASKFWME